MRILTKGQNIGSERSRYWCAGAPPLVRVDRLRQISSQNGGMGKALKSLRILLIYLTAFSIA